MRFLALLLALCCGSAMGAQMLRILDARGNPLPNFTLHGRLTVENVDWLHAPSTRVNEISIPYPSLKTDARGYLNFGEKTMLPPGRYRLALASEDTAGPLVSFVIGADGQATIDHYALAAQPRDITQTVFGKDGKPLPHAVVSATYCWQDLAYTLHATANAEGTVVWKDVPPVRLLVWGPRVAQGVLPADATQVTAPLLPVETLTQYTPLFQPTVAGTVPEPVSWWRVMHGPCLTETEMGEAIFAPGNASGLHLGSNDSRVGDRLSVIILAKSLPPRVAYLDDAIMPMNEYGVTVNFPITFHAAPEIRGRLLRSDGRPLPGVSRLGIAPADVGSFPQLLRQPKLVKLGLMCPVETGDGSFAVRVPVAGKYRLLVDLYDDKSPLPPALQLNVVPGVNTVAVKLPAPLIEVPAGTVVRGLARYAPANPTFLTVAAHAPLMPVFGPTEGLLGLAYRTTPNTLCFWTAHRPLQTLKLRDVTLSFRNAQGNPYQERVILLPLLPLSREEWMGRDTPELYTADTKRLILNGAQSYHLQLWPGTYTVECGVRSEQVRSNRTFQVPAQGSTNLVVSLGEESPRWGTPRALVVTLPKADDAQRRGAAAEKIAIDYNVTRLPTVTAAVNISESFTIKDLPERATALSLTWLGVGTARNIPLGKPVKEQNTNRLKYTVMVPAWEPGATVSGFVLQENGEPYANRTLTCSQGGTTVDQLLQVTTDALGGFLVKGIPPGTLCFYTDQTDAPRGGWALEVPSTDLRQVVLRKSREPIKCTLAGYDEKQRVWWIPDGGPARRLPSDGSDVVCHDAIPAETGWIWSVDNTTGRMQCLYLNLAQARVLLEKVPSEGGPLCIYLRGDFGSAFPAGVTLEGLDRLSTIRAEFPNIPWQSISLLGITATQLDSVPPGNYRITVDTRNGKLTGTVPVTEYGGALELRPPTTH